MEWASRVCVCEPGYSLQLQHKIINMKINNASPWTRTYTMRSMQERMIGTRVAHPKAHTPTATMLVFIFIVSSKMKMEANVGVSCLFCFVFVSIKYSIHSHRTVIHVITFTVLIATNCKQLWRARVSCTMFVEHKLKLKLKFTWWTVCVSMCDADKLITTSFKLLSFVCLACSDYETKRSRCNWTDERRFAEKWTLCGM